MAQVSIADVDNLKDASDALVASLESARETLQGDVAELAELTSRISDMQDAANRVLEELQMLEAQQQARIEELVAERDRACADLEAAENDLSQAESDLASARADVSYDEDGNEESPDTSSEEAAVAAAEVEVEHCRALLEDVETQCHEAEQELARTSERRRKQESVHAMAVANDTNARQQKESFCVAQRACVASVEHQVQMSIHRLQEAHRALDQYLAEHPSEAAFAQWVHWQPTSGQPVTPIDIRNRLQLTAEQQHQLARYLYYRDPIFRGKIDAYRARYEAANGGAERSAVLVQASRGGSGDLAERMVKFAFSPIGTVSTQDRRYVEGEHYTKIDLVVTELKNPVILGRGTGMGAPVGGSLAIEVKSGHPQYLYAQKDHMRFQAAGHQDSSASVVICSGDIHDLPEDQERELRDALRAAGSPIVGMLPRKDELDATIWDMIDSGRSAE